MTFYTHGRYIQDLLYGISMRRGGGIVRKFLQNGDRASTRACVRHYCETVRGTGDTALTELRWPATVVAQGHLPSQREEDKFTICTAAAADADRQIYLRPPLMDKVTL